MRRPLTIAPQWKGTLHSVSGLAELKVDSSPAGGFARDDSYYKTCARPAAREFLHYCHKTKVLSVLGWGICLRPDEYCARCRMADWSRLHPSQAGHFLPRPLTRRGVMAHERDARNEDQVTARMPHTTVSSARGAEQRHRAASPARRAAQWRFSSSGRRVPDVPPLPLPNWCGLCGSGRTSSTGSGCMCGSGCHSGGRTAATHG